MKTEFTHRRPALVLSIEIVVGIIAAVLLSSCKPATQSPTTADAGNDRPITLEWVLAESDRSGLGSTRIRRLLTFVDSLDPAQLEPTIDRLLHDFASARYVDVNQMLYSRWWQLDRDAALEHAFSQKDNARQFSLGVVISLWTNDEPMAAWQWFEENSGTANGPVGHSILREIARDDPPKALDLFASSKGFKKYSYAGNPSFLYGTWAQQDPAAAAAHLDASSYSGSDRASAAGSIIVTWLKRDVDAAWQWAKSARSDSERHRAMETLIAFLAHQDADRAEQLLEEFPQGSARQSATSNLVGSLINLDPERAFEIGRKHDGSSLEAMSLGRWATIDTDKALEVAKTQLPAGPRRKQALDQIVRSVADRDLDRAIEIFKELAEANHLTTAANVLATKIAQVDLERARIWAESLADGELKDAALNEMTSVWLDEAPQDAAAYALRAAEGDPAKQLLRRTLASWGYKNPEVASRWVIAHLEASDQRALLPSAVGRWAEHDPQGASVWTAALPPGDVRDACIASLGFQWGHYHPAEGEKWLQSLPVGSARDQAINNYASRAFEYDPEKALLWCEKIDDQKQRENSIQQMARNYLRTQPKQAREWIRSSSMSDEQKNALLGPN